MIVNDELQTTTLMQCRYVLGFIIPFAESFLGQS
jgi:hypothetical protein